jgi:hypothetical protein
LGMVRLPPDAKEVVVSHACQNIAGAVGVMIEISMPNKSFPNTNGNQPSGVGSSMIGISGIKGTYALPLSKFPVPGLYCLRAIAIDANHRPLGSFSDDVFCLINRRYPNGWSEQ